MSKFLVCLPRNSSRERNRERYLKHRRIYYAIAINTSDMYLLRYRIRCVVRHNSDILYSTGMK